MPNTTAPQIWNIAVLNIDRRADCHEELLTVQYADREMTLRSGDPWVKLGEGGMSYTTSDFKDKYPLRCDSFFV